MKKIAEKIPVAFVLIAILILMDLSFKSRSYDDKISQETVNMAKSVMKQGGGDMFGELYLVDFKVRQFDEHGKISSFLKVKEGWKGKDDYLYLKDVVLLEFSYTPKSDRIKCVVSTGTLAKCNTKTGDVTILDSYSRKIKIFKKEDVWNYLKGESK